MKDQPHHFTRIAITCISWLPSLDHLHLLPSNTSFPCSLSQRKFSSPAQTAPINSGEHASPLPYPPRPPLYFYFRNFDVPQPHRHLSIQWRLHPRMLAIGRSVRRLEPSRYRRRCNRPARQRRKRNLFGPSCQIQRRRSSRACSPVGFPLPELSTP